MESKYSDVYRALQQHLDTMPVGFPPTESGSDLLLLAKLFTPEEAQIATNLRYSALPTEPLDDIYKRLASEVENKEILETVLDGMVSKGLLIFKEEGCVKFYNNAIWVVGIYEFQVNKLTPELLALGSQYGQEAYGQAMRNTSLPQLRVIPIQKSINHEHQIAQYDDVRNLIDSTDGPFVLVNCICQQARGFSGQTCEATERMERCIGIGEFAQMYIDQGWGREVSKDELVTIVAENEKDGLVLQPNNSKTFQFLCSCCGCCCGILSSAKHATKPVALFATNYYSEIDHDLCTDCGTCIEKCQMDAISHENDIETINLDRCIGCGVCVANCPEGALQLQKRTGEIVPPRDMHELYSIIQEGRKK